MVPYFGDFALNATVYIPINTFDSNDPAASVTVTNLLNTDVHIHKNGGTTQRNNAAGITMSIDYDSITGNHLLTIDTSDNTVADFYQAGYEYQVRVEGITVDGGTLNAWVGCFSIERSGGALALLKNATYGLSAIETLVDDILVDTGTTLDALIKDVPTVAEFEARTIAAADYVVVTDTIAGVTTVGTTTNLTNLPNIPANWLTAAGLAADAVTEIQSGLSTLTAQQVWEYATRVLTANTNLSILDAAGIRTAVGLASANLDTQLDALPTAAEIKTALEASNSSLDYLMRAIVYKNILTFTGENEGNLEMFNAAGGSIGTVIDAFTEDATTKIRAKLVPA